MILYNGINLIQYTLKKKQLYTELATGWARSCIQFVYRNTPHPVYILYTGWCQSNIQFFLKYILDCTHSGIKNRKCISNEPSIRYTFKMV